MSFPRHAVGMDNDDALLKLVLAGGPTSIRRDWLDAHDGDAVATLLAGTRPGSPLNAEQRAGLRDRIAERGAVVSEFPPGTPPRTEHFPSRNRILAGLSLGTLVIEAAERSGALITARQAVESGREVFAVPGSIRNPLARGCHKLIRDGAALVDNAGEVVAALAPMANELAASLRLRLAGSPMHPHLALASAVNTAGPRPEPGPAYTSVSTGSMPRLDDPDYQKLWLALGHDPSDMDALVQRSGLTAAELSSMLLLMELDGRVAVEHGRYLRKS